MSSPSREKSPSQIYASTAPASASSSCAIHQSTSSPSLWFFLSSHRSSSCLRIQLLRDSSIELISISFFLPLASLPVKQSLERTQSLYDLAWGWFGGWKVEEGLWVVQRRWGTDGGARLGSGDSDSGVMVGLWRWCKGLGVVVQGSGTGGAGEEAVVTDQRGLYVTADDCCAEGLMWSRFGRRRSTVTVDGGVGAEGGCGGWLGRRQWQWRWHRGGGQF
ncbi:unnamed protein product [Cuscuta europaea]|uniref:Uncharacterized protein n=1 Tax=Cuscuta europaea TaxID=41803 RepID=A0A9P1ECR4_CUSEU|nr:unnamed protein product [Cuscuta europaea]